MKLLSICGTRPEAIKMAPVLNNLEQNPENLQSLVCVTAQHREMKERPDFVLVQGDTTTTIPMQKREGPKVMQSLHTRPPLRRESLSGMAVLELIR